MKRPTRPFLSPLITGFLFASLVLPPNSAYALREPNPVEGGQRAGLARALSSGLEESPAARLTGPTREITALSFDPRDGVVFASSKDNQLFRWDPASGLFHSHGIKSGQLLNFAFSPDGLLLATGLPGGSLSVWETASGKIHWKKDAHTKSVLAAAFSPNGQELFTASPDKTLQILSAADGASGKPLKHPEDSAVEMQMDGNRGRLLTLSGKQILNVWDFSPVGILLHKSFEKAGRFTHAAFLPDGETLLAVNAGKHLEVRKIADTTIKRLFTPSKEHSHAAPIGSIAVSPSGYWAASGDDPPGGGQGVIVLWDVSRGKSVAVLKGHPAGVVKLAFSPDERHLVSGDRSGVIQLWDLPLPAEGSVPAQPAQMVQPEPPPAPAPPVATDAAQIEDYLLQALEGGKNPWVRTLKDGVTPAHERWLRRVLLANRTHPDPAQVDHLIRQIRVQGGNLVVLPLNVLRRGAESEPGTATLYLAAEILTQVDLPRIETALHSGQLAPLLEWTDAHLTQETAPELPLQEEKPKPAPPQPEPGPKSEPKPQPAAKRDSKPEPDRWSDAEIQRGIADADREETGQLNRREQEAWDAWDAARRQMESVAADIAKTQRAPTPAKVRPTVSTEIQQQLAEARTAADEGRLLPNTALIASDPSRPDAMRIGFDTSGSKPDSFENIRLFSDAEIVLILPDPKRWTGRRKLNGPRFTLGMPSSFAEASKQAERVMTPVWKKAMEALDEKVEEGKVRMKAAPPLQREYLKGVVKQADEVLSLTDAQRTDARGRLQKELRDPAKVEEVIDAFDQMDRRMTRFIRQAEPMIQEFGEGSEPVEPARAREVLERLLPLILDSSPVRKMAEQYMGRLGAQPVGRQAFEVFLTHLGVSLATGQIPELSRVVPMGRVAALYHDAMRLARHRQLQEYLRLLEDPHSSLDELKGLVSVTCAQTWVLEWENAFYRYVLEEARPVPGNEKMEKVRSQGLGLLFLRPDGSVRRFVPGGGSLNRVQLGWNEYPAYFTFRFGQWFQPGDRVALMMRSDTGYPTPMQVRAFLGEAGLLYPAFPDLLLGTVAGNGTVRLYKPAASPADPQRWCDACVRADEAARPTMDLYARLEQTLAPDSKSKKSVTLRSAFIAGMTGTPGAVVEGYARQLAYYNEMPQRLAEFLQVLVEGAQRVYTPEDVETNMSRARTVVRDSLETVRNLPRSLPDRVAMVAGPLRVELLRFALNLFLSWSEESMAPLVASSSLLEPVEIPGLTAGVAPDRWRGKREPAPLASYGEVLAPARSAVQRVLRGEWGPYQSGFSYEGLGRSVLDIFVDLPPSEAQGFHFIMIPGAPAHPLPMPHPALVSSSHVRESGRYLLRMDSAQLKKSMEKVPGINTLAGALSLPLDHLLNRLPRAKQDWLEKMVPALFETLQRKDGPRGTLEDRMQKGQQRLGQAPVERALEAVRRLYVRQRELLGRIREARRALQQSAQGGFVSLPLVEEIFESLIQAAEGWPRVQQLLAVTLEASRLDQHISSQTELAWMLELLDELPQGVQQYNIFILQEQVPSEVLAFLYHDLSRRVFLDRLIQLRESEALKTPSNDLLEEIRSMVLQVLELEEAWLLDQQILQEARAAPLPWEGSHLPQGGVGMLLLKEGEAARFIPGAGGILRDRALTVYYFNSSVLKRASLGPRDTVVLLYPSILTGSPNIEQVRSFLEDWLLLQPSSPCEICMGAMTQGGTLRLFRPNLVRGDIPGWARLHYSLSKVGWSKYLASVYPQVFNPADGEPAEYERMHTLAEHLPQRLREGLTEAFGPEEAERLWAVLHLLFEREWARLPSLSFSDLRRYLPSSVLSFLMAAGEMNALSFVTNPGNFTQREIPGLASAEAPSEIASAQEEPAAPVCMPAAPIQWEPAAGAPVLGEPVDPAALRTRLKQTVPDLLEGKPTRDSWVVRYVRGDHSILRVYADVTSTKDREPKLQWVILPKLLYMPLIPDPRQLDPPAASYSSRLRLEDVFDSLPPVVHRLRQVVAEGVSSRASRLESSSQQVRSWLPEILRDLREAVDHPDSQGRTAASRLEALQQSDPEKAAGRSAAIAAVRDLLAREADLAERIGVVQRRFTRMAQDNSRVAGGEFRALGNEWLPRLAPWPRTRIGLELYLQELVGETTLSPQDLVEILEEMLDGIRHETPWALNHSGVAGAFLLETYYDAFRAAWKEQLIRWEARLSKEGASEKMVAALLWAREQVMALEIDAALSQQILSNANKDSSSYASISAWSTLMPAVGGVGALFIDPEGKMRLALGAGGLSAPLQNKMTYSAEGFLPWYRPGDTVVLLYPCLTGSPSVEQIQIFAEDWFRIAEGLPGSPQVWLGAAAPNGALRLFRPQGSFSHLLGAANEKIGSAFGPFWSVVYRRFLAVDEPAPILEIARHFQSWFEGCLVQSGAFETTGAAREFQAVREVLGKEVGAGMKDLFAMAEATQARELKRGGEEPSDQFFESMDHFRRGLNIAVGKAMIVVQERMAQPLLGPDYFTEVPVPGAPDEAEQRQRRVRELADSAAVTFKGWLDRAVLETLADQWLSRQSRTEKIRKTDFIHYLRARRKAEENEARQKQWIGEQIAGGYAEETKTLEQQEEQTRRGWLKTLADQDRQREIGAGIAEEYARETRALADQEERAAQGWLEYSTRVQIPKKPVLPAAERNKGRVRDLSLSRPKVSVVSPVAPAGTVQAQAEIARIEGRLASNLAGPEADFEELLAELEKTNGISPENLDAEWKGRLNGIRMALAGAVSGRVSAEVDQALVKAAQAGLDAAQEDLTRLHQWAARASAALEKFPMFRGPVDRQMPVLETTQKAVGLMIALRGSDEPAELEKTLLQSREIPPEKLHGSWKVLFLSARKEAAEGLADGVLTITGDAGDPRGLSEGLALLERYDGYLEELGVDGNIRQSVEAARLRAQQRLDHWEQEQALGDPTILGDVEDAYQIFLRSPDVPPEGEGTLLQSLKARLDKAVEMLGQADAPGLRAQLKAAGFQLEVIRRYREGRELQEALMHKDRQEVEEFVYRTGVFLRENPASDEAGRALLRNRLIPDLVAEFGSKLFDEIGRIMDLEPELRWREMTGIRPAVDQAAVFLLGSGVYNPQDQAVVQGNQRYLHRNIEAEARERAVNGRAHLKQYGFQLERGGVLRLVHSHSGRVIEVRFNGEVEQPNERTVLAKLEMDLPPGLVAMDGDNLTLAQKHGDWRGSRQLLQARKQHEAALSGPSQPVRQFAKIQPYQGKFGISDRLFVFGFDEIFNEETGFVRPDSGVILSAEEPQEGQVRIQDLYCDLQVRLEAVAQNLTSVRIRVDDSMGLFEKPQMVTPRAGMEEAKGQGNTVLFLRSDLFDPEQIAGLDELALAGLGLDLRRAIHGSDDGTRDLQLVLVSGAEELRQKRAEYRGWRTVEVLRKAGSDARPLPVSAIPWVTADALVSGRSTFEVVVTPYLHLMEWTLPEALEQLSLRFSA